MCGGTPPFPYSIHSEKFCHTHEHLDFCLKKIRPVNKYQFDGVCSFECNLGNISSDNTARSFKMSAISSDNTARSFKMSAVSSDNTAWSFKMSAISSDNTAWSFKMSAISSDNTARSFKMSSILTLCMLCVLEGTADLLINFY